MAREKDWNPAQYLKFRNERTQPSIDLVNRIRTGRPLWKILDIGCGPGNSSQVLLQRWPDAKLTGIDNSPAMIEKARQDFPDQEWIIADARAYTPAAGFDLVFSNATIQWIPNHLDLLRRIDGMLSADGVLAIQVPRFNEMVISEVIDSVSQGERWRKVTKGCAELFTYHDPGFYYDVVSDLMEFVDIWETDYFHSMESHLSIVDWIRSTGMKPHLDAIGTAEDRKEFEAEVLTGLKQAYPTQSNGRVLFPFKRLFFIGYKANQKRSLS